MTKRKLPQKERPRDFKSQTSSRFLLLPGEICNHIYRAALVKPGCIDLCPDDWLPLHEAEEVRFQRNPEAYDPYSAVFQDTSAPTLPKFRHQQDLQYVRQNLAVGLLRTCLQVRREAMGIFWSENRFRFSLDLDWLVLRRFHLEK